MTSQNSSGNGKSQKKSQKASPKTAKKAAKKTAKKTATASSKAGADRAPRPLALRRHLDTCTVAELEEFYKFWNPHQKNGHLAREKLIEKLYRVMSDENVVYAKVELLSETVRGVLLSLLKSTHYTADLQGIFRTDHPLQMEYYEAEAALTALSKRGFVRVRRAKDWLHFGRNTYAIPLETAGVMQGLSGTDRRTLPQIFVRAGYEGSTFEQNANLAPAELPEDLDAAFENLAPQKLKEVAKIAIEEYGGIVTRHEFATVLQPERKIAWASSRFLRGFGGAGLGTVGHVDLRAYGLGVDDDALLFFQEACEGYLEYWRKREFQHDLVLSAHGDLLTDVCLALQMVREFPIRVGKEGAVYKSARGRISERFIFAEQPLIDRTDLAELVLMVVQRCKLAEPTEEGMLEVSEKGHEWGAQPLQEKLEIAYDVLTADAPRTLRSQHLRRVREIIVDLLIESGDAWFPGPSLAMTARNRYLVELTSGAPAENYHSLSTRHAALTELGRAAEDLVQRTFYPLGLVDIAMRDGEMVGARLSQLGRRFFVADQGEPEPVQAVIVNPDFEVLVLPETGIDDLLHHLDRIAERVAGGEVLHYRLDRKKVERVTVSGTTADEILDFLSSNARAELPQNVVYSIRSWSKDVRSGSLAQGILFTASHADVIEAIRAHRLLKDCIEKVVDERTVFFNERILEKQIETELRSLGVYVV
ncbi:MAG: helicase-associated domain-containing protein [Planctomycetota bacterium]